MLRIELKQNIENKQDINKMKIMIYGFGTAPIFFKALIEYVSSTDEKILWSAILPTSHHIELMRAVLTKNNIKCIHEELPSVMRETFDLDLLKNYPNNIFKDIETEKITLKHRDSKRQVKTALATYKIIKHFLIENEPDYILYAQPPEGMDGMILAGVARELGIQLAVPHHTRNIGRSFFSDSEQENLKETHTEMIGARKWAEEFLSNFREKHIPLDATGPDSTEEFFPHRFPGRVERTIGFIKRFIKEPENREIGILRVSFLNSWFPIYRNIVRGARKSINRFNYNCKKLNQLPEKFIFYPLQYTPESSINVPAPYFIDQNRIIDAIRMSMPNDYQLVIKEHPSCISVRNGRFTKNLLCKAGVIVAYYKMDTQEMIKRSALTITVTGTAAFEAFLYGKPSLVMGPAFFSRYVGGICGIDELPERIITSLNKAVCDKFILQSLREIYSASENFVGRAADENRRAMMTKHNIITFWNQFKKYINKTE